MERKAVSGIMLTLLLTSMLTLAFNVRTVKATDFSPLTRFEKILMFEDDFENGIAGWWNEISGTPTLSTDIVHSGNYSYVTDEDLDYLAYHWFNTSIIGEMEAWFYDSMSNMSVTSIVSTDWDYHYVFGALMWYGVDYGNAHHYYYRLGDLWTTSISSCLRTVGWHRVNIIHEPERAYILLDGELLVEINHTVAFRGFTIGDHWIYDTVSFSHYDDVKVWRYVPHADVAVTNAMPNKFGHEKHHAYPAWTIYVNVTVLNNGTAPANITVTAYFDESGWHEIGNKAVTNLAPSTNTTVTFSWDLSSVRYCNHTIKANATLIGAVDTNPANNEDHSWVKVKMPGDVDNDSDCDVDDVFTYVSPAYGKSLGQLAYDQQCDFDGDGDCDADDIFLYLSPNYGKSYSC